MGNCWPKEEETKHLLVQANAIVVLDRGKDPGVPSAEAVVVHSKPPALSPAEATKLSIISKLNVPDTSLLKIELLDLKGINAVLGNIQYVHNRLRVEVESLLLKFTTDVVELEQKFQVMDLFDWAHRDDAAIKIEKQDLKTKYGPTALDVGLRHKALGLRIQTVQFHLNALLYVVSEQKWDYDKSRSWVDNLCSDQYWKIGNKIEVIESKLKRIE